MKTLFKSIRDELVSHSPRLQVMEMGENELPDGKNCMIVIDSLSQVQPPFNVYQAQVTISFFSGTTLEDNVDAVRCALESLMCGGKAIYIEDVPNCIDKKSELDQFTGEAIDSITYTFHYRETTNKQ